MNTEITTRDTWTHSNIYGEDDEKKMQEVLCHQPQFSNQDLGQTNNLTSC